MKRCQSCKEILSKDLFHKNSRMLDGLEPRCKACRKAAARRLYEKDPFSTLARLKKSECKKKSLPFDLDPEYLKNIWTGVCPITNSKITIGNAGQGSHKSAHLDRLNPKLGYVKGNVQYISGRMNRIKYDASVEELEQLLTWMKSQESATTIPTGSTLQANGGGSGEPVETQ